MIGNNARTSANLKEFMSKLNAQIGDDKDKTISLKSESFKETIYNSINSNTALRDEIMATLKITDAAKFTKASLFDGTSETSKKFLQYLQLNLSGKPTLLKDATGNINVPTDFVIYTGIKKELPPPTPPTTPSTTTI